MAISGQPRWQIRIHADRWHSRIIILVSNCTYWTHSTCAFFIHQNPNYVLSTISLFLYLCSLSCVVDSLSKRIPIARVYAISSIEHHRRTYCVILSRQPPNKGRHPLKDNDITVVKKQLFIVHLDKTQLRLWKGKAWLWRQIRWQWAVENIVVNTQLDTVAKYLGSTQFLHCNTHNNCSPINLWQTLLWQHRLIREGGWLCPIQLDLLKSSYSGFRFSTRI